MLSSSIIVLISLLYIVRKVTLIATAMITGDAQSRTLYTNPRGRYCNASAKCCTAILSSPARSAIVRLSFNTR